MLDEPAVEHGGKYVERMSVSYASASTPRSVSMSAWRALYRSLIRSISLRYVGFGETCFACIASIKLREETVLFTHSIKPHSSFRHITAYVRSESFRRRPPSSCFKRRFTTLLISIIRASFRRSPFFAFSCLHRKKYCFPSSPCRVIFFGLSFEK